MLIILNIYNDFLFPNSFIHSPTRLEVKFIMVTSEGILLILVVFVLNQAILSDTENKISRRSIAKRTAIIQAIVMMAFIILMIFKE